MREINRLLQQAGLEDWDQKKPPAYLQPGWKPKGDDRPDRIVSDVRKSVVLQVKCAELPPSKPSLRGIRGAQVRGPVP